MHIFDGFPIPDVASGDPRFRRVVEIAARLAAVDDRFEDWASTVGVPVGSVKSEADKQMLMAELDALVAHLYGLSADHLGHIFATFHRGWDFAARLAITLDYYEQWGATHG
jgi:hypothetical protein